VQSTTNNAIVTKRLLIVVPIYASYRAFLKGLSAWLVDRDWEVHVATNLTGGRVESDVATLHDIAIPRGANLLMLLQAGRSLTKLIQQIQPTVVHAHFSVGMLCLALANQVKGIRRLGTFQGMRFPMTTGVTRYFFMLAECFSILRLDKSWVLTADDYDAVPRFAQRKLVIQKGYGFGCDVEHFNHARFSDSDKAQLRSELEIPSDDHVFIFIGRFTDFKGFPLAIKAFKKLREERNDVHFVLLGEPDPQHPIDALDLNSLEGVSHVGWQDDPAPYLAISNTMLFPSEREGMPVCVMEALSMGIPVLALRTRGANDLAQLSTLVVLMPLSFVGLLAEMKNLVSCNMNELSDCEGATRLRNCLSRHLYYNFVFAEISE
jgi:glycosyltransferase involved in cell wall biosynthesis